MPDLGASIFIIAVVLGTILSRIYSTATIYDGNR